MYLFIYSYGWWLQNRIYVTDNGVAPEFQIAQQIPVSKNALVFMHSFLVYIKGSKRHNGIVPKIFSLQ